MTDRRRAPEPKDRPDGEDNPFAPPPEGTPDRPWQPRLPEGGAGNGDDRPGDDRGKQGGGGPRWGSQWSSKQPEREKGRWGDPAGGPERRPGGLGGGPRGWDPTDPAQRHARYAMLAGMWGVCSGVLLGWLWLALLLGALGLYWGVSSLRGGPKDGPDARDKKVDALQGRGESAPPPPPPPPGAVPAPLPPPRDKPLRTPAIAGIVLSGLALVIVVASYTLQLVYKDYFDCVDDALTQPSRQSCEHLLPRELRPILGEQN
ncbi:hypothetical protein [Streptomyces avicenniae]|uniref:hypothetical protein n=1 Tax=Streptomyces avicenniae TaxID=500153 RepID=UPI000699EE81|nr:hypothetical protein [Streptomyces avicenniae]